ncbi:helix-turn-helix domain-containing protein [Methylobacterium sp. J-068]|uniref:helix-turn-helix domain-containing protein n=1 Tax=Methylobacterium sp. J-068 TaxID=2836649 RepID=UPI001FB89981|nr:helix-turn-helix domain-containing protein [Methylobacterium sp. J-068]MCJ2037348.1 helix-turn-helix domain-containing protein [Methylobacterium sp. J-068]
MQRLFSTEDMSAQDAFRRWREICEDRLVPMSQNCVGDRPFHASIDGTVIGGLAFTKFALSDLDTSTTSQSIRHRNNKTDFLYLSMMLAGNVNASQNDRSTTDATGDLSIRDTNTPWTIEHRGRSELLTVEIPRARLESVLGSARHFAGLTMSGRGPVTILARSFLCDLLRMGDQLTPQAAERMTSIGVDLVVASLAERMAKDAPKPLRGVLIVQRAKAYVAANLGDHDLDPSRIASAMGVSLRHLQTLFREDGHHIGAWIWQQRLEKAARHLSDPGCLHKPLNEVAFRCGFGDPAHFSRRFRDRFGMSPRDYRQTALVSCAALRETTVPTT